MRSAWAWYLGAVVAVGLVVVTVPAGAVNDFLCAGVGLSASVATLVGIRVHSPRRASAWVLLAVGVAAWATGDLLWGWFDNVLHVDPFPSVADVAYVAAYPLLAGALYRLARGRNPRGEIASVIDALVVASAVGFVLLVVFVQPAWSDPGAAQLSRLVAAAYPVGDVLMLVQLVYLRATPLARTRSLDLLTGSFVVVMVADVAFQASQGSWTWLGERLELLDPLWLASYALWGAAALHPSMARVTEARPGPTSAFTIRRIMLLAGAFLLLPATALAQQHLGVPVSLTTAAVTCVWLVVLIAVRVAEMVHRLRDHSARLEHLADTDFLTGLENRRKFTQRLDEVLDGRPGSAPPAVLLAGLDRFTETSDILGHRVGDEMLRAAARGVREVAGESFPVARLGGDVFAVLVPAAEDRMVELLARRLRVLLSEPFDIAGVAVNVGGAVGVAQALRGDDAEEVLRHADLALGSALASGTPVVTWSAELEDSGAATSALMSELQHALEVGEIVVHFQPQVEVATGAVLGAEALVRWVHPERGLVPPHAFVPAAERTSLIRLLTLVVLDRAVGQCAAWAQEGRELTVAVNLSVRNLLDPRLVDDVREILAKYGVPADRLELEITETAAMVDPVRSAQVLGALADLGVVLSVDDYGTGYGSLAYLQRLPVRRLKIDRSFVAGITHDPASAAIVASTIELASRLGLSVVAEGVEDDATLLALRAMRCFAAQGFGIGRPVPPGAVQDLFAQIEQRIPVLVARVDAVPHPRRP